MRKKKISIWWLLCKQERASNYKKPKNSKTKREDIGSNSKGYI